MRSICLAGLCLVMASSAIWAQSAANSTGAAVAKLEQAPPDAAAAIAKLEASVPTAKDSDVHSIDAIMVAIYYVISGLQAIGTGIVFDRSCYPMGFAQRAHRRAVPAWHQQYAVDV